MTNRINQRWLEMEPEECTKMALSEAGLTLIQAAEILRPEIKNDSGKASAWIRDCLNPQRPARLTEEQHIHLGNITSRPYWLMHFTALANHTMGQPIDMEKIKAQTVAEIGEALNRVETLFNRFDDLNQQASV